MYHVWYTFPRCRQYDSAPLGSHTAHRKLLLINAHRGINTPIHYSLTIIGGARRVLRKGND